MDTQTASAVLQHPAMATAMAGSTHAPAAAGPGDYSATLTVQVTRNTITVSGVLNMGHPATVLQRWERLGKGSFALVSGPREFVECEDAIGLELAEALDRICLPTAVANMLPGKRATPAAIEQAAKAVAHG